LLREVEGEGCERRQGRTDLSGVNRTIAANRQAVETEEREMRILTQQGTGRHMDEVTEDFNTIEVYDDQETRLAKIEMWMAKKIGTAVSAKYRNRQWKIQINLEGQMLVVACDSISNYKGYHIHMIGRNIHELGELAVKAAGEILERHNLARSKYFNPEKFEDLKRDYLDNVIAADSAAEPI
jgi:hypothetical protein